MVTAGDDDPEFLFDGSDDDFDGDLQEEEYDLFDREQGKCTVILQAINCSKQSTNVL